MSILMAEAIVMSTESIFIVPLDWTWVGMAMNDRSFA